MGDYISTTDLNIVESLKQYLSSSSTSAELNRVMIDTAIEYAEGMVKSWIGMSLKLPLDSDEETKYIMALTEDIAIWRLQKNHPSLAITVDAQLGYDEAKEALQGIASKSQGVGLDDDDATDAKKSQISSFLRS